MSNSAKEQNIRLNRIFRKLDELYHSCSVRCGFSDAVFWILYSLYENDGEYTQNTFSEMWGFPKQTVNSAISGLVKSGYIKLEQITSARNSKAIHLTERGEKLCQQTIAPIMQAEQNALLKMEKSDRDAYIALAEKNSELLHEELKTVNIVKEKE